MRWQECSYQKEAYKQKEGSCWTVVLINEYVNNINSTQSRPPSCIFPPNMPFFKRTCPSSLSIYDHSYLQSFHRTQLLIPLCPLPLPCLHTIEHPFPQKQLLWLPSHISINATERVGLQAVQFQHFLTQYYTSPLIASPINNKASLYQAKDDIAKQILLAQCGQKLVEGRGIKRVLGWTFDGHRSRRSIIRKEMQGMTKDGRREWLAGQSRILVFRVPPKMDIIHQHVKKTSLPSPPHLHQHSSVPTFTSKPFSTLSRQSSYFNHVKFDFHLKLFKN